MPRFPWILGVIGICVGCCTSALVAMWIAVPDYDEAAASTVSNVGIDRQSTQRTYFVESDIYWMAAPAESTIPNNVVVLTHTLERLHGTALTAFESAPNFGYLRMPPVFRESTPPRHVPLLAFKLNTIIEKDRKPIPGEPKPTEAWMWLKEMAGLCSDGFVYRPKEVRWGGPLGQPAYPEPVDGLVCGYPDPNQRTFDEFSDKLSPLSGDADMWRVASMELIGLWQREFPMVFEHRPEGMTDDSVVRVQTRHVTRRETAALSKLQENAQLVATFDSEESMIRLVGAIRAGTNCIECHKTEEGTLLGAFTYRIEPRLVPSEPSSTNESDDESD